MFESHFLNTLIYRCYILLLVLSFTGPFHRYSTTTLVNTSVGRRSRNEIYGSSCPEGERTKHLANTKQRGKSEKIDMRRHIRDYREIIGNSREPSPAQKKKSS